MRREGGSLGFGSYPAGRRKRLFWSRVLSAPAEAILAAVRRASEDTGVAIGTDEVIARLRLERAVEIEARKLGVCRCGHFDWDGEDD